MVYILLGILATWRLTSLLNRERGPYDILVKFRKLLGVRFDEYSEPYATKNLAEGVLCFRCCSVWGGTAIALLMALMGIQRWLDVPLLILALSSGGIVIEELLSALPDDPEPITRRTHVE